MAERPSFARGHAARSTRPAVSPSTFTPFEKSSGNDKYRTRSLVTCEGPTAPDRRGRRLHKLVRADGPGKRAAGERAAVGSDPVPQELDPGALRRAGSHLLAG